MAFHPLGSARMSTDAPKAAHEETSAAEEEASAAEEEAREAFALASASPREAKKAQ